LQIRLQTRWITSDEVEVDEDADPYLGPCRVCGTPDRLTVAKGHYFEPVNDPYVSSSPEDFHMATSEEVEEAVDNDRTF
jgi:hypothetical protein